ncbi:hypothetical protein Dimus_039257 [Dionaea muscipula]
MAGSLTGVFLPNIILDESNYPCWLFRLESFLKGHKLYEYVDGTKPYPPSSEAQAYSEWQIADQNVINVLGQTLGPAAIRCVVGSKTSKEMWGNLKEKFAAPNRQHIVQLKTNFQSIKKGGDSIEIFLDKIKSAKDALETVGVHLKDEDVVVTVLAGLPAEYAAIKTVIRAQSDSCSLGELKTLLKGAEYDIEQEQLTSVLPMTAMIATSNSKSTPESTGSSVYNDPQQTSSMVDKEDYVVSCKGVSVDAYDNTPFIAFYANTGRGRGGRFQPVFRRGTLGGRGGNNGRMFGQFSNSNSPSNRGVSCQLCGRPGHIARNCYDLANYGGFAQIQHGCQYCGKRNHTADRCFHLIGFPNQGVSSTSSAGNNGGAGMVAAKGSGQGPAFWLADSGATNHMTGDVQLLHNLTEYPTTDTVQIGNGENLHISHTGNSTLGVLAMSNVLLIPQLAANLLSPYQLCKQNNCRVILDDL